jgi:hypothetical protein
MIDHLNNLLRHLFLSQVAGINDEAQVRFQPPDEDWRGYATNLQHNALNVYLVDLRENRKLRSNERTLGIQNGIVSETPAPLRVDCHYLITAWSPAILAPAVEPTADEHALLYNITAVLMNHESLVPRQVYAPDPLPAGFPDLIADAELPIVILPVEGFPKYAEFWGTMGAKHPWKPAIYLVVTLPVALQTEISGPIVTTRITEYRQSGQPETAEVWVQIGGTVLAPSGVPPRPTPVARAWVRLETPVGEALQTTETNDLGRFTFGGLHMGSYQLRVQAEGHNGTLQPISVPSPTGSYDVTLA